jgi:glucan phosphorylase
LERLSYEKLEALTQDKVIVKRMNDVYAKFKAYVDAKPDSKRPSVAYFCMEYGLTHVLKIYSGGLGILAGDYLKEASDSNVDMCGVGFLYRYGYFSQSLSMDGQQIANYESQNFGSLPIERVMDGYFNQGSHHLNVNVFGIDKLKDAMEHPEKEEYQNFTIRVSGYAVKFIDLTREQQLDVIARQAHERL